MDLDFI